MIISLMVMADDGEHFGLARQAFDEKHGLSHRELHKLYQRARHDLSAKMKKLEELREQRSRNGK